MKRFGYHLVACFAAFWLVVLVGLQTYASEKEYVVNVPKDYNSAKFTITFSDDGEYSVKVASPNGKAEYEATVVSDRTMECVINEAVKAGKWNVTVTKEDTVETDPETGEETPVESPVSGVSIKFEGSTESIVDVSKDIKVATDIAGLQMYFKDDNFVAEWTDTTCGDVIVEVTDEKSMESLAKETVSDQYFEVPLDPSVDAIVVKLVPSVSANEEGAEKQYTIPFVNDPDAIVTYEDISITNRDSIRSHVVLNAPYAVHIYNNDKLLSKTDTLDAGEYDFDIPTQVGDNNFKVYIVDENHNMRSTAGFVEKDVVAPILQLVRDYTEIYTEDASVTFEGKVEDYDYFTINDKEIKVEGDHTFKYEYELKEGSNVINILAEDLAGNQSLYVSTIYRIIPEVKPIPWSKIIPGALLVVLFASFLIDSIRKNYGLEQKKDDKKTKEKTNKDGANESKRAARGTKGVIIDVLELVIPLSCAIIIFTCVIQITTCQSGSMEPNIVTGNTVLYNKLAYKMGRIPQRGDVVNFYSDEYHDYFSKRIMGIPGDVISFQDGYVVINGQYVDESAYIDENIETNSSKTFTVPDGCYFMLGDNRENSNDSRYWMQPFIPFGNIKGKYMGQIEFSIDRDILHTL